MRQWAEQLAVAAAAGAESGALETVNELRVGSNAQGEHLKDSLELMGDPAPLAELDLMGWAYVLVRFLATQCAARSDGPVMRAIRGQGGAIRVVQAGCQVRPSRTRLVRCGRQNGKGGGG